MDEKEERRTRERGKEEKIICNVIRWKFQRDDDRRWKSAKSARKSERGKEEREGRRGNFCNLLVFLLLSCQLLGIRSVIK